MVPFTQFTVAKFSGASVPDSSPWSTPQSYLLQETALSSALGSFVEEGGGDDFQAFQAGIDYIQNNFRERRVDVEKGFRVRH